MKVHMIVVAVGFAAVAGAAGAAGQGNTMPSVSVRGVNVSACTPPNGATGHACDSYDAFLHANFSAAQIRMLFGCWSCAPGYLSGEREQLVKRYDALLQQYVAARSAVGVAARVASR